MVFCEELSDRNHACYIFFMNVFIENLQRLLPPVDYIKLHTEADCYGISKQIANQFYLPFSPRSFCGWLHGWMYPDLKYPEQFGLLSNHKYLVATKEHKHFLMKHKKNAKAVGAPYIYAEVFDVKKIQRKSNTLLVMPPHGLPYTTEKWDEEVYIKQIDNLKDKFDYIVACIHPSCAEKNSWIVNLEKYKIPWVVGADMRDKNALIRMRRIFRSFEYMTTNCIGSHVAYAAYSGCKVSIFGNYAEFTSEDVKGDILYMKYPHVMEHNLRCSTKKSISKKFPFLFAHPKAAVQHVEWGSKQLGAECRSGNVLLAWHLGWFPHQQAYFWGVKIFRKIKKEIFGLFR